MNKPVLFNSIFFALRGIRYTFIHESNFRIQVICALVVVTVGLVLPLKTWEFLVLVLMAFLVMVLELINTALELFADLLMPRLHHHVGMVKDVMAGAVFLTAITAGIVGMIVLGPYLVRVLQ
jgi:undecaprenol kinase/diacylglycerol kinase (ATP)